MNPEELSALFEGHATQLAPALLGCELTVSTARGPVRVQLTEVEAYGDQGEDPGAHSYNGRTLRNASLFGPPRRTYVYLNYGIHRCLNLACNKEGTAGGVLLRAGEVTAGRDLAVERRRGKDTGAKLLSGPGRLGQGLGIELSMDATPVTIPDGAPTPDRGQNGWTLTEPEGGIQFVLRPPKQPVPLEAVRAGPRVGVSGEGGSQRFPWRYWLDGAPSVSAYRPGRNVSQHQEDPARNITP